MVEPLSVAVVTGWKVTLDVPASKLPPVRAKLPPIVTGDVPRDTVPLAWLKALETVTV